MGSHNRGYSVGGKGVSNAICEICRGKFKNYELLKRWDGLMVCEEDWEPRHISDFYRQQKDNFVLPFIRKEVNEGVDQVRVVLSADVSSPTLSSWTLLGFDTETSDTLSEFTTGTSTFQPTANGTYAITVALKTNLAAYSEAAIAIYKNGSVAKVSEYSRSNVAQITYNQFTYELSLVTTDTITARYYVTGTGTTISSDEEATFMNVRLVT